MTQAAVNNAIVLYRLAVERRDVEEAQSILCDRKACTDACKSTYTAYQKV